MYALNYISVYTHVLVDNAILLAQHIGVSTEIIGLTVIAVGTSLPELTTSIIASLKKQSDVALGNILGSNIYNSLFILGFIALFKPIPMTSGMHVLWMTGATLLFLGIAYARQRLSKMTGVVFLGLYAAYIFWLSMMV